MAMDNGLSIGDALALTKLTKNNIREQDKTMIYKWLTMN